MKLPRLSSSSVPSPLQAARTSRRTATAPGSVVPMTLADCMAGQLGLGPSVTKTLNSFCDPNELAGEAELDCYLRLVGPGTSAGMNGADVRSQYDFCKNSKMARQLYGDGQFATPNW
jgi:hypothetical protein